MGKTLLEKVWDLHTVRELPSGQTQLFIGLHLVHEVTSPQAFKMLKERDLSVRYPERTFATVDHIIPTLDRRRPFADAMAEEMFVHMERNAGEFGLEFFDESSGRQGIVHVIGPELGLTQPGMTIACGDSHTSTHGAFGSVAIGVGTSQIRDVLASGCLAIARPKVRRFEVTGSLSAGVYPKDVILHVIGALGVHGGVGYAYEYGGDVFDAFSMEDRMTVCNMSVEGGARVGYVNPDQTTYDYIRGRDFAPKDGEFDDAVKWWESMKSDGDADYDSVVEIDGSSIEPMVTWGINPGQVVGVGEKLPDPADLNGSDRASVEEALAFMNLKAGAAMAETPIDVAFIGSCTNGRISDLREAAKVAAGGRAAKGIKALVVPGSQKVREQAEAEGLHETFLEAGFEWREAGCSMCLAMNPDKLVGEQICASSSNRNFKGRQGSPTGRTLLMSPAMVAAAALAGAVVDVRTLDRPGV
ncbi:MAG: 3-isopropylmalate dehydratase large subunit [Gammaproteobacteria bacterium]|jgi:3-isopropylmalate/(R)-2-methylmalate dehydratase large subunit|nr:3-isopropylmalate dehydratase large subunit [Gammaproteobacteria bacterium]